jgi:hypothetical protein
MSRRREPRVEVNFEVKVWGMDRHGKPFMQHAHTLDITRSGARLAGIECVQLGEIIGIQSGGQKARFKVVWMGRENTPKAGQIGVHCVEPEKSIFLNQSMAPAPRGGFLQPLAAETCMEPSRTARPVRKDSAALRRKHPRYPCTGGVEIRQSENGPPTWGNLSDISLTGCYVETVSTLPQGSMPTFHLRTHNLEVKGRAVVKTSHHGVGMGIAFLHLNQEYQQNLEFLLGMLAGIQEMRPEEKRTFVPADAPMRTGETVEIAAPVSLPRPPGKAKGDTAARIMQALDVLAELERQLLNEKVDSRLIAQFHDALEHTRQNACTIQHWMDLGAGGGDPFAVLPLLETERINMLMKLARNVLADIDSSGLTAFSEGTNDLYAVVQQLHKRLAKIFAPDDDAKERTFGAAG